MGAFVGLILFVALSSAPPLLKLRNERSSELRIKSVLRRGGSEHHEHCNIEEDGWRDASDWADHCEHWLQKDPQVQD